MKCNPTYLSCCALLLLVIYVTDQLTIVTGHSLKSAARRTKINKKVIEEVMNKIRHDRKQQQRAFANVRSTTRRAVSARLDHSITLQTDRRESPIGGLATRDNKLYVGYVGQIDQPSVDVYDVSTFRLQRSLSVTGLGCIYDMASCPHCDSTIFISDACNNMIHVTDDVLGLRTQWSVDSMPFGVSVNAQSNVIVTFMQPNTLREYTPSGELVREITLQSDIQDPWHAIQLDNDRYVVAHGFFGDGQHRVCIVSGNGAVVNQCYGGLQGSGVGQLNSPAHLAIFGESLLVVDTGNYRVLQLNVLSLSFTGELINTRSEGWQPVRMALNEDDARLYVYSLTGADQGSINVYRLITE